MEVFAWYSLSNPLSIWWSFLLTASLANIALWFYIRRHFHLKYSQSDAGRAPVRVMLFLSAIYVFGCAFRAILPRADVQHITLFDTWLSSVLVGRSVATIAELAFVLQWAIALYYLAKITRERFPQAVAYVIVPMIAVAECFSWYAVISKNYFGNVVEESLWAITFLMVAVAFFELQDKFRGWMRAGTLFIAVGMVSYVVYMLAIDVPMYYGRWYEQMVTGAQTLGFARGLFDLATGWIVTHNAADWHGELIWMSLYFSLAVWASLGLALFAIFHDKLRQYLSNA